MNGPILLKQLCTVGAILLCLGVSGCRDDVKNIYKGDEGKEEPEKVPNDFDFSTRNPVTISLDYDVPQGYRVLFEVYTINPLDEYYNKRLDVRPFLSGYADEKGHYSISVPLASSVKELYAYSYTYGVPMLMRAMVNNGIAEKFEPLSLSKAIRSVSRADESYYKDWKLFNVTLEEGVCEKVTSIDIDAKTLMAIDYSLPDSKGADLEKGYFVPHITLKEDAEIKIYYVGHGEKAKARTNSLAYFTYEGSNIPTQNAVNQQLIVAFPSLSELAPNRGTGVALKYNNNGSYQTKFPKNTTLSFALLVDAGGSSIQTRQIHAVYSEFADKGTHYDFNHYTLTEPNASSITYNRPHMWGFSLPDKGDNIKRIVLGFEDQPWNASPSSSYHADCRDDVFILEINPPAAVPDEIKPGVDPDKEEIDYDESSLTSCGILAFEDLWPNQGDYDLNDVIISYERTLLLKVEELSVVGMNEIYTYLHNGATKINAFGYQMAGEVKRDEIKKVTISSDYECDTQGLDPDLDYATVMVFDNGRKCPVGTEFKIHTTFIRGLSYFNFISLGSVKGDRTNPFIVIDASDCLMQGRTEVHLPTFDPTPKCNKELFKTGDDLSSPGNYYVRGGDYPFAIDLAGDINYDDKTGTLPYFKVPQEGKSIDVTYPYFTNWVESKGIKNADWYKHPAE